MGKKTFWIQTGAALAVNISIFLMARVVTFAFVTESVAAPLVIIVLGYIISSVFMVKWTRKPLHFPLVTLILQVIVCVLAIISLYTEISEVMSSDDGFMAFLGIIMILLLAVLLVALPAAIIVTFLITLVPSLIANHIYKKREQKFAEIIAADEIIQADENINNVYELKGSIENDQTDT